MQEAREAPSPTDIEKQFGERVRNARLRQGVTQQQLADALDVDSSAVSRLEKGTRMIRLNEAVQIARVLNEELGQLVFGDNVDPGAAFLSLQESADRRIDETRSASMELANAFLKMLQLVETYPDFFGSVELGDAGPIHPIALEAVLPAGLARINNRYAVAQTRQRIVVDNDELASRVMELITATVQDVVSTVPLPTRVGLGRGLEGLIPTGLAEAGPEPSITEPPAEDTTVTEAWPSYFTKTSGATGESEGRDAADT